MDQFLTVALEAAREAGAVLLTEHSRPQKISYKGDVDLVTETDKRSEALIVGRLRREFPEHRIVAEEGSGGAAGASEYEWHVDPLDGTTNFIHGFPVYAVSIALAWRGVVQQAVVYDPSRNDLFIASRGRGAYLNERRLRVSKRLRLADSLIGTGFPFRKGDHFKRYMKMFEEISQQCAGLRRPGAASLDLCYVAAGYYDGFWEIGLNPWDVAAGSLLITEAGGLVGDLDGEGEYLYGAQVIAANPRIFAQMVKLLAPHRAAMGSRKPAAKK